MKKMKCGKSLLGLLLVFAMLLSLFATTGTLSVSADASYPIVTDSTGSGLKRYSGSVMSSDGGVFADVADGPVDSAFWVSCKSDSAPAAVATGGIRQGGDGIFQVTEANSLVAVSYYVKATITDGTPKINAYLQYTTNASESGGAALKDVNSTGDQTLVSGNWVKCVQYFDVTDVTGVDVANKYGLRFVLGCSVPGQSTYLGSLQVYNFGSSYTYKSKAGAEAAAQYLYDIEHPVELNANLLNEYYNLCSWGMSGSPYYGSSTPELTQVSGQSFTKAIKFWGNDDEIRHSANPSSQALYRGQLAPDFLLNPESITKGDKIYISFWAKAYNDYGTACEVMPYMDAVTAANAWVGYSPAGTKFKVTDTWKKYSTIIPIEKSFEEINADTGKAAATYRVCMRLATLGQVTYMGDFQIYRCDGSQTDSEIMEKLDNVKLTYDNRFTGSNSNISNSSGNSVSSVEAGAAVNDSTVPFSTAQKFTSLNSSHQARIGKAYVNMDGIQTNDILVMSFWAKGWQGTDSTNTGIAAIKPRVTKVLSTNSYSTDYPTKSGSEDYDGATISLTDTWKRYAVAIIAPDMTELVSDGSSLGMRIYLNTNDGTNQERIVWISDLQLYDFGQILYTDAKKMLADTSLEGPFIQTRAMSKNANGSYTAWVPSNTSSVTDQDITYTVGNTTTEAYYTTSVPDLSESGNIRAVALDGTVKDYTFTVEKLPLLDKTELTYNQKGNAQVILRCDDLYPSTSINGVNADGQSSLESFEWVLNEAEERGMQVSFGLVGSEWENAAASDWETILDWQNNHNVEFWLHGYDHDEDAYSADTKGEYGKGVPYEFQLEAFTKAYDIFANQGITMTTFAAPFNETSVVTSAVINAFNASHNNVITAVSFPSRQDDIYAGTFMMHRVNLEDPTGTANTTGTGLPQFDCFKTNLANADYTDYFVVQVHPTQFDNSDALTGKNDFEEYTKFLDYIAQNGYSTTTHRAYVESLKAPAVSLTAIPEGNLTAHLKLAVGETNRKVNVIYALYSTEDGIKTLVDMSTKVVALTPFADNDVTMTIKNIPQEHTGYQTGLYIWDMESGMIPLAGCERLN